MTFRNRTIALAAVVLSSSAVFAQNSLAGRWDAAFTLNGTEIPFRLDISEDGQQIKGTLFNGDRETETTTTAKRSNNEVVLDFEHYLTTISANANGERFAKTTAQMAMHGTIFPTNMRAVAFIAGARTALPAGRMINNVCAFHWHYGTAKMKS